MKQRQLLLAVRRALTIGVASAMLISAPGFAQEEEEGERLNTIVVTGSRIRQVDTETEAPVLVIDRAEIEKQGFQSVGDILQNVPSMGSPPISRAAPLTAGENAGGTYIDMRNLGPTRTLVLVNGKRLGISTSGLADVSTIPAVAIDRIEILKDGASALYGSDAIAGVINIITRSNYEGARASAYYGQYDQGDGEVTKADFILGFGNERGSLTVAADWTKEDVVPASARPFSAFPRSNLHPDLGWTTVGQYGGFAVSNSNPVSGFSNGRYILGEGANPYDPASYRPQNTSSTSSADKSNTNLQTDLRTPLENKSIYVDGIYNFNEYVSFKTNLLYSNRLASRQVAGYPMQAASFSQTAPGISVDSYFNPFGSFHAPEGTTPQDLRGWWRRGWEVPRVSDSQLDTYRFSGVFEGSFQIGERYFNWDAGFLSNTNDLVQSTFGNFNLANVAAGTGPSFLNALGAVQCGTEANPIPYSSCIPFNPLLPFGTVGEGGLTDNEALQNYLFQEEHSTGKTETTSYTANITGNLFAMPAGDFAFAAGLEHRKEEGKFVPDPLAQTGGSTNLSAGPTGGQYSVDEVYLEFQIPVLADMAFAQELTFDVATRYSDYDTFGDTLNSKAGFRWKPIDELLFRGTWAEGFRAPTIANLYGGGSQTFSFFTDPCDVRFGGSQDANSPTRANCRADLGPLADTYQQLAQGFNPSTTSSAQTPVAFTNGSNPFLQPETSTSRTLGVVWSPNFSEGLNMSLDWWKIRVDNTIVADSPNQILNDCYNDGIAARCLLFTRDPNLGYVSNLRFGSRNAGYRETEGYDLGVNYRYETENWGTFGTQWNTTYTVRDEFISTNESGIPTQLVAFSGGTFRNRSTLNLSWDKGDFGVGWNIRYYSAIKEDCLSAATYPDECNDADY
ncbi:TonB-dependent receptor plug domain-containing protein, partial [Dokdonella sp.]|uniref:TonB-dependent receptor plug domain-containing protein n=1 Tax=Dokdonella sp. TaxID=2291710 RepID=UPI003C55ED83